MHNLVQGEWRKTSNSIKLMNPLNRERFISVPDTSFEERSPFVQSLRACPKSGLHNPLKNPERYILYGEVMAKAAYVLKQPQLVGVTAVVALDTQEVVEQGDEGAKLSSYSDSDSDS